MDTLAQINSKVSIRNQQIQKNLLKNYKQVLIVLVSILAILTVGLIIKNRTNFGNKASNIIGTTFLTFLPSSGSFPLQTTNVDLIATLGTEKVDGVQAIFTISNTSNFSDISFQPNTITGMQLVINNKTISATNTQFQISYVTQVPNQPFTSQTNVNLGHLIFKPSAAGNTTVSFNTNLSKIIRHGTVEDVLNTPQNVTYQFIQVTPTPTFTSIPQPTQVAVTPVPTPTSTPVTQTGSGIQAIEDTYVDASATSVSHATDGALYVDNDPNKVSYMLFDLTSFAGGNIINAKLSFKTTPANYSGSPDKVQVYLVNDVNWSENITFSNKPQVSTQKLGEILAPNPNTIYNVDLDTSVVKSHLGGRLALAITPTGGDALYFNSRESGSYKPQLIFGSSTGSGSAISIFASGTSANGIYPNMDLLVNDIVVASFLGVSGNPSTRNFLEYKYVHPSKLNSNQIKVKFTNDANNGGGDINLVVDRINLDGVDYQSEGSSVYGTGVWTSSKGCTSGYLRTEWLYCNGYFQY